MPKLPLFEGQPLDSDAVAAFRELLNKPEQAANMLVIDSLLDIHNNPESPPSEPLILFVIDSGILGNQLLQNFIFNAQSHDLIGKRATMRLQINQRVLAHAAAAGFCLSRRQKAGTSQ